MSPAFQQIAAALAADAALRERVMAATTIQERAAILTDAGLAVPSAEELADRAAGLDRAQGGQGGVIGDPDAWLFEVTSDRLVADDRLR